MGVLCLNLHYHYQCVLLSSLIDQLSFFLTLFLLQQAGNGMWAEGSIYMAALRNQLSSSWGAQGTFSQCRAKGRALPIQPFTALWGEEYCKIYLSKGFVSRSLSLSCHSERQSARRQRRRVSSLDGHLGDVACSYSTVLSCLLEWEKLKSPFSCQDYVSEIRSSKKMCFFSLKHTHMHILE